MTTKRPYIICHMGPSIDGRIVTRNWRTSGILGREYERTARTLHADGWNIGRVSMEPYAGRVRAPSRRSVRRRMPRRGLIGTPDAESYAIASDAARKLMWKSHSLE